MTAAAKLPFEDLHNIGACTYAGTGEVRRTRIAYRCGRSYKIGELSGVDGKIILMRWMTDASRRERGETVSDRVKILRRENAYRIAEANKAFGNYRF